MAATRTKHVPQRRCVICGEQRPKQELIRVVRAPGGDFVVDAGPKVSGRGAYVCRASDCLGKAADGKRVGRALHAAPPPEAGTALQEMARQARESESDVGR